MRKRRKNDFNLEEGVANSPSPTTMLTQMPKWIKSGLVTLLVIAVIAFFIYSCGWIFLYGYGHAQGKKRFDALDAARTSAPYLSDFTRLFPKAEVNYRYFTSSDEPGFDVEVDLYDRYEFTMQLPAKFDSSRRKVVGYGEPAFYLLEVESQDGRSTSYNPKGERKFGSSGWQKIIKSGGDFAAIGYSMKTNQPVPGFHNRKVEAEKK